MPYPQSLRKSLERHEVDPAIVERVFDGFPEVDDKSPKEMKVAFMRQVMKVLDETLDFDNRCSIIGDCACCLGGSREKKVKEFKKEIEGQNLTFAERVDKLRQARPFFNSTRLNADGTITDGVYYQVDGAYRCACGCIGGERLDEPISSTYCLCCAGHFRHHLQNALDVKLRVKGVVSSPLDSLGKAPCVFTFEAVEQ